MVFILFYVYKTKKNNILKETAAFMRNIHYARLRDYSIANLLKYEITSTSFYFTKDGVLREYKKSGLATVTKKPFKNECISEVPICNKKAMLVVDFMAYDRKVPVKKTKLNT